MSVDIDKINAIEKLLLQVGKKTVQKAVMFKNDKQDIEDIEDCLKLIGKIQARHLKIDN